MFALSDIIVVGVVNEEHPQGVFNPDSLKRIYDLTEYAKTLTWPNAVDPDRQEGVVEVDMIAPSTVDNIEQGGPGTVNFSWLMATPPATPVSASAARTTSSIPAPSKPASATAPKTCAASQRKRWRFC